MQLTISLDSASASPDDYRRAASTLLHFGLGPGNASLTLDRVTLSGPVADVAASIPDPATLGFGAGDTPPAVTPDPATVGFGSESSATAAPPAAPDTASAGALARVELDHDQLPHDTRIHASTKTKNKDGRWKKKKGVDDATVARVEGELRSIMNLPPAAPPSAVAPPPPTTPAPPATTAAAVPPPPPTAATGVSTFSQLMGWVGPSLSSGRLSATAVEETLRNLGIVDATGVGQLALLASRPDLVPGAYAALTEAAGGA